ncbi:alcohol dehydrogenase 1-like isoform X1 [Bidens hawaiensis]|uniref:alcohol dehydrogenase 1-like isoform X1 n=1 Tax=Bidens hawaiensis TaxID=980011 RepID=UPI00404B98D6
MAHKTPHVITCKAAVVREAGGAITVEEIHVDPPKATEVRIKMLCASICHTDILYCNGKPIPLFPRITGHEGVGYVCLYTRKKPFELTTFIKYITRLGLVCRMVESIGEDVGARVKPGDVVMPLYLGECGECLNCKSGKTNICHVYPIRFDDLMRDGTSRTSVASTGETVYHHFSCSTWSEYTVVDVNYVMKVDPRVPFPHASLLSCGFTTGLGAPWKEATVSKGSSVAVFGLGVVGLGVHTLKFNRITFYDIKINVIITLSVIVKP